VSRACAACPLGHLAGRLKAARTERPPRPSSVLRARAYSVGTLTELSQGWGSGRTTVVRSPNVSEANSRGGAQRRGSLRALGARVAARPKGLAGIRSTIHYLMDLETYRSLVLLLASAFMSTVVAWWLSWTRNRRDDRVAGRAELVRAIDQTMQNWYAEVRWLIESASGKETSQARNAWGAHVYPYADEGLIGEGRLWKAYALLKHQAIERRGPLDGKAWAAMERDMMAAFQRQRDVAKRGMPVARIPQAELEAINDAARRAVRGESSPSEAREP